MKKIAVTVAVLVVAFFMLVGFFLGGAQQPADAACGQGTTSGGSVRANVTNLPDKVGPYSGEQLENAALIINAGETANVPRRGQIIAVMTAIAESTLENIGHGDAVGPDSRGLFQQRAVGWGPLEDRMDPTAAATSFYEALLEVEGWESMEPTLAASAVQRNADPYVYAKHWQVATQIVDALEGAKVSTDGESPSASGSTSEGQETSPSASSEAADPEAAAEAYDLGPVKDVTAEGVAVLAPRFDITTVGGHRPSDPFPDHPSGLAADFMVPTNPAGQDTGARLATFVTENADALGVKYILWNQRSWYPDRGWRPMEDRGNPTANHEDHVHVTFLPDGGTGQIGAGDLPAASACAADEGDSAGSPAAGRAGGGRVMPNDGPMTSGFGPRNAPAAGASSNHKGQDFGGACGTSIKAAAKGTVVYAGPMDGYGYLVEIDHGGGTTTRYAHMFADGLLTRVGEDVDAGKEVAKVGTSGTSTGCHLHFEVRQDGEAIDPAAWLEGGD